MYPSALREPNCSTCHSFPFLFRLPRAWLFIGNSAGVSKKAERGRLSYQCIWSMLKVLGGVRVAHLLLLLLLLCMYYFGYFMYFVVCVSVFHARSLLPDYILSISARILVPLNNILMFRPFTWILISFIFHALCSLDNWPLIFRQKFGVNNITIKHYCYITGTYFCCASFRSIICRFHNGMFLNLAS